MPGLQTQTVGWATARENAGALLVVDAEAFGVGALGELEQLASAVAASAAAQTAANRLTAPVDVTAV
jgi:hypothetical protein